MKYLTLYIGLALFFMEKANSQEIDDFHLSIVNQVSSSSITSKLQQFHDFGNKEMGTSGQENTMNWIIDQYESWGYTDIELQEVNVFGETGYNIIITKTGTVHPDTFVVIDGHYDTINGPGANDNGSGTTVLLEVAERLKNVATEYSIKFIHFTGEELGLIGSEKYVEEIAVPQNLDIKLVLNVDQVGGVAGETNNTITCERDLDWPNSNNSESETITSQLAVLMEIYSDLETNISYAYASDYVPFQEEGFVITGLYEFNESPFTHSSQDTFENMDPAFVFQVAKGTLGALCYFSRAYDGLMVGEIRENQSKIFPNPADGQLFIQLPKDSYELNLYAASGQLISTQNFSGTETVLKTNTLNDGVYLLKMNGSEFDFTQKIIIKH